MSSTPWDGERYQRRLDAIAAEGGSTHGEADLVMSLGPSSVLDAGCGTGRVAIELAGRGVEVVGADVDPSMLEVASGRAPDLTWVHSDLADLDLGRTVDVVLMAGNVPLFTPPGTQASVVAGCARHLAPGGALVSGFSLGRGYEVAELDEHCAAVGLELDDRWSTWEGEPFTDASDYAVSIHRRRG